MIAHLTASLPRLCLALILPLLAGCAPETQAGPVVLAASSLQESLGEVAAEWARQGHRHPVLSFAGSAALARQVERGAPADLFVSADEAWMDRVEAARLLRPGTRGDVVANRLVVVAPLDGRVNDLRALGRERLALADPQAVPAGRYARASLESLGLWERLEGNVVPSENVRAALAFVERGEAALGVVYATDARASARVRVVEQLPPGSHPPIRYPAAVLAASDHPDAEAFRAFLASAEARRIFDRRGFVLIE